MQKITERVAPKLANHLTALPGTEWAVWRWCCVRGAGFPAIEVLKLRASEEVLRAADQVYIAKRIAAETRGKALEELTRALDDLRSRNQWHNKDRRNALLKAQEKLKTNKMPVQSAELDLKAISEYRQAVLQIDAALAAFREKFSFAIADTSRVLRETAASPQFREAVTWQNRRVVRTVLDPLLCNEQNSEPRTSRDRQREELVASYLQRYCLKNDTIGFFGPVGWARFFDNGESLTSIPGKNLLDMRKVYFETWGIEALAAAIACDPEVYPWLSPITMPFVRVNGFDIFHPIYGVSRISSQEAAILQSCNGSLPARQLADDLLTFRPELFASEAEIYDRMADLVAKKLLYWNFVIPVGPYPEVALRAALDRIEDGSVRARAMASLDELEAARERISAAAGDAVKLDAALNDLEERFTRLTNVSATRNQGQVYAAKTIVYEDCRRDAEIGFGEQLRTALSGPLSLLLQSARWVTSQVAALYQSILDDVYEELVSSTGSPIVEAALLWLRAMPFLIDEDATRLVQPVFAELEQKWSRILNLSSDAQEVQYSTRELEPRVLSEFMASTPGWSSGCYHCPDIMIAASSEEEVRRGEYLLVLGELHAGGNTLNASLFVNQHPALEDLICAVEQDLGTCNLVPVAPKEGGRVGRTAPVLYSPSDYYLEYAIDAFTPDRSKAVPVSELMVIRENGILFVVSRDRKFRFKAIDLIAGRLADLVLNSFKILSARAYTPRVLIDRLVVMRQSWRITAAELTFIHQAERADRFLFAREWAQSRDLPRCVFFKVAVEPKPSFLDFDSPILVDIFCKIVRHALEVDPQTAVVDVSEMLPRADQYWLRDAENKTYSSEIRMVAVDLCRQLIPEC